MLSFAFASDIELVIRPKMSLFHCRLMLCISAAYAVVWCLSVGPSVCYVGIFCRNE